MSEGTVILIHGLWMHGSAMALLKRHLGDAGFEPVAFSYRTVTDDLDTNAEALAEFIEPYDSPCYLVGHSLGGVVMLTMLDRFRPSNIDRGVCMGSPLASSVAARTLGDWPGSSLLLGESHEALANRPPISPPQGYSIGMIAGDAPMGLGRLVAEFDGPNDGTVAVEETKVDGLTDHVVLKVSHLAMLWSSEVGDEVISFLRSGHFSR